MIWIWIRIKLFPLQCWKSKGTSIGKGNRSCFHLKAISMMDDIFPVTAPSKRIPLVGSSECFWCQTSDSGEKGDANAFSGATRKSQNNFSQSFQLSWGNSGREGQMQDYVYVCVYIYICMYDNIIIIHIKNI